MKLLVKFINVADNTTNVIDETQKTGEYIPEEELQPLPKYDAFKYSKTCTINITRYNATKELKVEDVVYTLHDKDCDRAVIHFDNSGYYTLYHIVLPTIEWLGSVKELDLSYYQNIYVTDGLDIYKYKIDEDKLYEVLPEEIIEVNTLYTTISLAKFNIFCLDYLERCYIKASMNVMNTYTGKCAKVDDTLKFNRDFIWMTLNVIKYHLQHGKYEYALMILENLRCYNFCSDLEPFKNKVPCGCSK